MPPSPFTVTPTPPTTLKLGPGQEGLLSFTVNCLSAPDKVHDVMLQALLLGADGQGKEVDWLIAGPQRALSMPGGKTETVTITARPTDKSPPGANTIKLAIADRDRPNDTYAYSPPVICEVVAPSETAKPPARSPLRWLIPLLVGGVVILGGGALVVWKVMGKEPAATVPDAPCGAESDTAFCARIASACEKHTAKDNCGVQRTVDCGGCTGGQGCVVGTCKTPVCTTFNYTSTPISTFTRPGIEDSIGAVTPDGQVILYIKSVSTCREFHLVVADETAPGSGAFTLRDVTAAFDTLGLYTGQDGHAITTDGLTIITRSADSKRLLSTKRSAINAVDFGPASARDFDQINAQVAGNAGTFWAPVISADGLEFFYTLTGVAAGTDGIYSSVRPSASVPFPAGTKLQATAPYPFATGVSSDRLALFVFDSFRGRVLTRNSTSRPFTNPNSPGDPVAIPSWQHKPLADCSKLVAMTSPGGCQNEDVIIMMRQ
jgi:hypothetical protein